LTNSDSEMQRFESTRHSQGVRSLRVKSDGAIASAMPFPGMALAVLTTSAYFPPEGYFATCPLGSFGLIGVVSVPGRGYNFVCPVSVQEPAQVPPPPTIVPAGLHNLPLAVTRMIAVRPSPSLLAWLRHGGEVCV
jgi:hypothetical protein